MSLLRNLINDALDDLVYEVNDKLDRISNEINLEEFLEDLNKAFDQASNMGENIYKKINSDENEPFEDDVNLYDIFYSILLLKNNNTLHEITINQFNYPNSFSLCVNDTNFWIKFFLEKDTINNKNVIYSSIYYLDSLIVVPFLGYKKDKKNHQNLNSILTDIKNYQHAVNAKLVKIY